jgi:hypothetical protein
MLMVTEMAGGFHLLVPAGMAVMIAYLLQGRLSARLKYRSLYEGQVPAHADSPAHYLEHIHTALNLLGRRNLSFSDEVGHLDLMRLLRSHVRLDLPGHKELSIAVVPDGSPIAGQPLSSLYRRLHDYEFEVIAITRREHVLLPHPDTLFEPGDGVLLIASPQAREPLRQFVTALEEENHGSAQTAAVQSEA